MIRTASEREDHSVVLVRGHGRPWDGHRIRIQKNTQYTPRAPRWHAWFHSKHVIVRLENQLTHKFNEPSNYACLTCGRSWTYLLKEMFR